MNYCPYCGASLEDSAASFCAECGKKLSRTGTAKAARPMQNPSPKTVKRPPQNHTRKKNAGNHRPTGTRPTAKPNNKSRKAKGSGKKKHSSRAQSGRPPDEHKRSVNPMDIGYDGYYDDVVPEDNGQLKERMPPELIKRIALVSAGALFIVILSVTLMSVL